MKDNSFKKWIIEERKKDIFGFEKPRFKNLEKQDDDPMPKLSTDNILDELSRYSIGNKQPKREWQDRIEWGNGYSGTLRIGVSPKGSDKIFLRRKILDLEGCTAWICKKAFDLTQNPNISEQQKIITNIYNNLNEIDQTLLDAASREYPYFEKLAISVATAVRHKAPEIFIFEGIKKIDKNNYMIFMTLRGAGVEAPTASRVEQFNINLQFDEQKGLIRCWGYDIASPTKQHKWLPQPSEWDEYFAPTQSLQEIENVIINSLLVY